MSILDHPVFQFFYGTAGVYIFAFTGSILHEKILKQPYQSTTTGELDYCTFPIIMLIFPYLAGWLLGWAWGKATGEIVWVPRKNLIYCASAVCIGIFSYNQAMLDISYPIVIMVKSCSVLSAIIVGVFFSRVRDSHLKLGINKLLVGALVTTGIMLFNFFSLKEKGQQSITLFGFALLMTSLIADGLLPDFQAEIKSVYKPRPVDLMQQINKWAFIFSFGYSVISLDIYYFFEFAFDHPEVLIDIAEVSILNFGVQMFVYYMIQKFKQHVAPFVLTIRKIFSVVISVIWFSHPIHPAQWLGVGVVFSAAIFDFLSEKYCGAKPKPQGVVGSHAELAEEQQAKEVQMESVESGVYSGNINQGYVMAQNPKGATSP